MSQKVLIVPLLLLLSCKAGPDVRLDNELLGLWRVDQVKDPDSSARYETLPEYNAVRQQGGSLFYKAKEINSTVSLGRDGELETKLIFTNFGTPRWTSNSNNDSLILKLIGVDDPGLVNDGVVDNKGDLYLYEGAIQFIDHDNFDWTLTDGRTFRMKRENSQ